MIKNHINSLFCSISYRFWKVLVDPGDEWVGFMNVEAVILTHAHCDHIYGLNKVIELNPKVRIYTNDYGKEMLLDDKKNLSRYHGSPFIVSEPSLIITINNGDIIELNDDIKVHSIFTPGHNLSCITWVIGDKIFTGDSYIPGIKPVTNLPNGNPIEAAQSVRLIKELSVGRRIFPGHRVNNE